MEYRTVPKTGDKLSVLGFGCMRLPVDKTHQRAGNHKCYGAYISVTRQWRCI